MKSVMLYLVATISLLVSTQLMSRYEQNLNYTSVSSAQLTTGGN